MDKRGLEIETYVLTQSGTQIMGISDTAYGLGRNTIQIEKNTQKIEVRIKVVTPSSIP